MQFWVLVLFAHVGALGNDNANALDHIPGFATKAECEEVGKIVSRMATGSVKKIDFVCVPMLPARK